MGVAFVLICWPLSYTLPCVSERVQEKSNVFGYDDMTSAGDCRKLESCENQGQNRATWGESFVHFFWWFSNSFSRKSTENVQHFKLFLSSCVISLSPSHCAQGMEWRPVLIWDTLTHWRPIAGRGILLMSWQRQTPMLLSGLSVRLLPHSAST